MTTRAVALEDVKGRSVEDLLREVAAHREVLTVQLPEGDGVAIQPLPRLRPLPELEGFVPDGWEEAIYEQ